MSDTCSMITFPSRWPSQLLRRRNTPLRRRNGVHKQATDVAAAAAERVQEPKSLTFYKISKHRDQETSQAFIESTSHTTQATEKVAARRAQQNEKKVLNWLKSCSAPPEILAKPNSDRIGFYDLPAEIRNRIAEYVLVHGHIRPLLKSSEDWTRFVRVRVAPRMTWISPTISQKIINLLERKIPRDMLKGSRALQWKPKTNSHPGIQFLATCSRAYQDYHAFLYARNCFSLTPGMPVISNQYFTGLHSKHWLMIKNLVVYFGTLDITPHAMVSMEYATRHVYNKFRAFQDSPTTRTWYRFLLQMERYLAKCWLAKLTWLRDNIEGKRIILVAKNQQPVFINPPLSATFGKVINDSLDGVSAEVQNFLTRVWHDVVSRVEGAIREAFHTHADGVISHHRKAIDHFKQWLAQEEEEWNSEGTCCFCGLHDADGVHKLWIRNRYGRP